MLGRSEIASVVIADDHPLLLRALSTLIAEEPDFQIISAVSDGIQALAAIRESQPDVAILDIVMPGMGGLDVLKIVVGARLRTRVVFLTASISDEQILDSISTGVHGLLLKESAPEALINSLRHVVAGGKWLPEDLVQPVFAREAHRQERERPERALTERENEIVLLVAEGLSNKHIAKELGLSAGTVKIHLHNVYRKLHVANRTTLAAMAFSWRESSVKPPGI